MGPFDFIILFISFIYTLALTDLLFAITRLIRHRAEVTMSWPHTLWMGNALVLLTLNWLSLWDFRKMERLSLAMIVTGLSFSIVQYFVCALASPDFDDGDNFDMRAFYAREKQTFLSAFLLVMVLAMVANFAVARISDMHHWSTKNIIVGGMAVAVVVAMAVRRRSAELLAPMAFMILSCFYLVSYYPELVRG